MFLKNKKGSHVGIIMSFTIFLVSLVFIFSIISPPSQIDRTKLHSIEVLILKIQENISEEVTIVLINGEGDCLSLSSSGFESNYIVKDNLDLEVPSGGTGTINIEGDGFSRVYFSDFEFDKQSDYSGDTCESADIFYIQDETIAIEKRITELIERYSLDYNKIKSELEVSPSEEFNIFFVFENETKIGIEKEEVNTDIFAQTVLVEYLDNQATKKIGSLIVKIW